MVLISASLHAKVRLYLREKAHIQAPLFTKIIDAAGHNINVEYEMLSSQFTLYSNQFVIETGDKGNGIKGVCHFIYFLDFFYKRFIKKSFNYIY